VEGLVLTRRRSPPLSAAVARASAGAVEWVPVARVPNLTRALHTLKEQGFWAYGATLGGGSNLYDLPDRAFAGDRVLVLGAEGAGIRPGVDDALDYQVEIPMSGKVASLNVSTAAAVFLFEIRRRAGGRPTGRVYSTERISA
jgi:23S rRNA (guanosine2251-2'-O)-methyltransferase